MIEAARNFICVKVNVSTDPDTAIAMGVEAIPTVTFVTPDGDPLHEDPLVGAVKSHILLAAMRAAANESSLLRDGPPITSH